LIDFIANEAASLQVYRSRILGID